MQQLPQEALNELNNLFITHYNKTFTEDELKEEAYDLLYIYAFSQKKLYLLNDFIDYY